MQISLWFVLAAALALALLLQRHFKHLQYVETRERQDFGSLHLNGPANWTQRRTPEGVVFEEPPTQGEGRRTLEVWHGYSGAFVSPLEYLIRSRDLSYREAAAALADNARENDNQRRQLRLTAVAGWPGILLWQTRVVREGAGEARPAKHVVACAVLPSFDVVVVRLTASGVVTAADEDLVSRVAESISLDGASPPQHPPRLDLPQSVRVKLPAGSANMTVSDPFLESRTVMLTGNSAWLAIELVPCMFLPEDNAQTLLSMLMWRDPLFRAGRIKQIDASTWMCARREDALLPAVAYLRVNPDGRALLAEFRWVRPAAVSGGDDPWIEGIWQELAGGIEFAEPEAKPADLVLAGDEAVAQLPADSASMISDLAVQSEDDGQTLASESKWQWYHENLVGQTPCVMQFGAEQQVLKGRMITAHSPPLSDGPQEECRWQIVRNASPIRYEYRVVSPGEGLWQISRVADGRYETTVGQPVAMIGQRRDVLPQNYIPGALLIHALGYLPDETMILSSESILDPGSSASASLLRLTIQPADDVPKMLSEGQTPQKLRCWKIHVDGASTSSRWYLDPSGELHSISFAGHVGLRKLLPEEHN